MSSLTLGYSSFKNEKCDSKGKFVEKLREPYDEPSGKSTQRRCKSNHQDQTTEAEGNTQPGRRPELYFRREQAYCADEVETTSLEGKSQT